MSNNPPKEPQYYLDRLNSLKDAVTQWTQGVVNGGNAGKLRDLIGEIKSLAKDAEKDRKATKEPYLEQGRKIDASFKPVTNTADSLVAPLNKMLTEFLRAEDERKRKEAEEARRKAEEEARRAEALKEDEFVGASMTERAKQAEIEAKRAARQAEHNTVAGADHGRAMGLRTYYKAKIIDSAALVAHFASHPDVIAAAEKLANAQIRAAKGSTEIPGVEVVEDKRIA